VCGWLCCWQGILADKDSVIVDLKHQVRNLREDLNMAKMDADRKSVAILTKVRLYSSNFVCLYVQILSIKKLQCSGHSLRNVE